MSAEENVTIVAMEIEGELSTTTTHLEVDQNGTINFIGNETKNNTVKITRGKNITDEINTRGTINSSNIAQYKSSRR